MDKAKTKLKATMDRTHCELVEVVPGKVSGVPILKHSRVPGDGWSRVGGMLVPVGVFCVSLVSLAGPSSFR